MDLFYFIGLGVLGYKEKGKLMEDQSYPVLDIDNIVYTAERDGTNMRCMTMLSISEERTCSRTCPNTPGQIRSNVWADTIKCLRSCSSHVRSSYEVYWQLIDLY